LSVVGELIDQCRFVEVFVMYSFFPTKSLDLKD